MRITRSSGVFAICFAEKFLWNQLKQELSRGFSVILDRHDDFIWVQDDSEKKTSIVLFADGCGVFWGLTSEDVEKWGRIVRPFAKVWHSDKEHEEFYQKKAQSPKVEGNTISVGPEDKEGVVAISYALAQAVKLSQYEVYVEKTMEELESIPHALARHGKIPVGRRQALKKTGKILMVRSKINLHSDLLDTPDYFWDRPNSEKIYLDALKEMDLNKRLGNLNKRLDIMQNIYGLLISQIEHSHTFWLEVVIILLIGVEVIFGVLNLWHINGMHG